MFESPYFYDEDFTISIEQASFIDQKKCKIDIQNKTIESLSEKVKLTEFEMNDKEINIGLSAPYVNSSYPIAQHYYINNRKVSVSHYSHTIHLEKNNFEEFITIPYDSHKIYEIEVDDHIYYDMNKEIKIKQKI